MRRLKAIMAAAACLAVVPAPALAAEPTGTGTGSVGAVNVTVNGQPAYADAIAPCAVGTMGSNMTNPIFIGTRTRFGTATTSCGRNPDGTATVSVSGQKFESTVLNQFGGPTIRAYTFKATCDTTQNGSRAHIELGGVTGIALPSTIPPNYAITIYSSSPNYPPLASVVVNELVVPNPADGSLVSNVLHIKLFPQGGPASGDIVVGTAACSPYDWSSHR